MIGEAKTRRLLAARDDAAALTVSVGMGGGVGMRGCVGMVGGGCPARLFLAAAVAFPLGGVDGLGQPAFEIALGDGRIKVDAEMLLKTPAQDLCTLKSRHAAVPHG